MEYSTHENISGITSILQLGGYFEKDQAERIVEKIEAEPNMMNMDVSVLKQCENYTITLLAYGREEWPEKEMVEMAFHLIA